MLHVNLGEKAENGLEHNSNWIGVTSRTGCPSRGLPSALVSKLVVLVPGGYSEPGTSLGPPHPPGASDTHALTVCSSESIDERLTCGVVCRQRLWR